MKDKWFAFHWDGDKTTYHKGESAADAARKAGYGAGALKVLDSTEEAKFIPLSYKEAILIEGGMKHPIAKDGMFHKELLKYLETVGETIKHHELSLSVLTNHYTLDVEIRKFEITAVVLWKTNKDGEKIIYKIDSEDGLFGFKYDYDFDSQGWSVVPNYPGLASGVTGTFQNWREAQVYCARLNDPEEFTTFICIDDQQAFPMSFEQQGWFKERNLSIPKRCSVCRDRKKDEKYMDDIISIVQRDKKTYPSEIRRMTDAIDEYISKYGEKWVYLRKARKYLREWEMNPA